MRNTVLLADNSPARRASLREMLEERFSILEAGAMEQMRLLIEHNAEHLAVVLMDISYLEDTQGSVLADMKSRQPLSAIPVIVVTRAGDPDSECRALSWGADDTVLWPFHSELVMKRINTIISLYRHQWNLESIIGEQQQVLRQSNEVITDVLSSVIEHRSIESGNHVLRIRRFTQILLEEVAKNCPEYNLTSHSIRMMSGAAALHDIGKIAIPDAILNKPGRLTPEEFELMKTHADAGSRILEGLGRLGSDEYLRYAYNICRHHHERWDGSGYPDGLAGDATPICAQVVGIADAYDALTTPRVYKEAYSHSKAVNMILMGECGQFSRKLLECFKCVSKDFAELARYYADSLLEPSADLPEPAAPPKRPDANAMETLLAKYDLLLSYLDATVIEIDRNQDICHIVCEPTPSLALRHNVTDLAQALRFVVLRDVSPEDRNMLIDQYAVYLDQFFESGLRRSEWYSRVRCADGAYRYYQETTLRIRMSGSRRALCVWRIQDNEPGSAAGAPRTSAPDMSLMGVAQQCIYDRELTMGRASEELCMLLGYTEAEMSERFGNSFLNCIDPGKRGHVIWELDRQLTRSRAAQAVFPMRGRGNRAVWVLARCLLEGGGAGPERLTFFMFDITGSEYVWKNHAVSSGDYRSILELSRDITFHWDMAGDRLTVSPRWVERFGYEAISENASVSLLNGSHFHPDDIPTMQSRMSAIWAGARFVEFMSRIADNTGQYFWYMIRVAVLVDEDGKPERLVGMLIDVNDNLLISPTMLENANRDQLTRLLHKETARRQIEAHIAACRNAAQPPMAAMAIIDLDNFKEVNDRFGHLFGDMVLEHVAMEISGQFRGTDIVARIGGDEFLVFVTDIPNRKLMEDRCGRLVERIRALNMGDMAGFSLACSIGIAFMPDHGVAYQELFRHADSALYQAKDNGKSCCVTYEPMALRTIPPSMIGRLDSGKSIEMSGMNIWMYAFDRLYESGDVEATISSLLEYIGRQTNVGCAYIFENNADNTACAITFEWVNEGAPAGAEKPGNTVHDMELRDYDRYFDDRDIFYCPDTAVMTGSLRRFFDAQGIRSALQCAIRDKGVFRGFVSFNDRQANRLWTQEQINLLTVLAKIISVFLLKKRGQDQIGEMAHDLRMLLDHMYAWVYVIEPDSFTLRFLNHRSRQLMKGKMNGQSCHKVFMDRDRPCDNCPIFSEGRAAEIDNRHLGLCVSATADKIHWRGKEQWLITCKPVPQDKSEGGTYTNT